MSAAVDTHSLAEELHQLYLYMVRAYASARDVPLTVVQRSSLAAIADGGSMRLHELAARVGANPPTASRAIDGLVQLGLMKRSVDPRDRRAVALELTARGRARVTRQRSRFAGMLAPALERLEPEERAELVRTMARLNEELGAVATEQGGGERSRNDGHSRHA